MTPKEQKIKRLKDGIASEDTPAHVKAQMEEMLAELEKPEPTGPTPEEIAEQKRLAEIAEAKRLKEKARRDKANAKSKAKRDAARAEKLAKETPPPPPPPAITAERKAELAEKYKAKLARKREREEQE